MLIKVVPRVGLEPTNPAQVAVWKTAASTDFANGADLRAGWGRCGIPSLPARSPILAPLGQTSPASLRGRQRWCSWVSRRWRTTNTISHSSEQI